MSQPTAAAAVATATAATAAAGAATSSMGAPAVASASGVAEVPKVSRARGTRLMNDRFAVESCDARLRRPAGLRVVPARARGCGPWPGCCWQHRG